jgi:hypothetical protein
MRMAFAAMAASLMAGPAAWAQAEATAAGPPGQGGPILPQVATSHAQIAQRLAHRQAPPADAGQDPAEARVKAAAKATEAAIADDPTVRDLLRRDPTLPPSLAGGAPASRPAPAASRR